MPPFPDGIYEAQKVLVTWATQLSQHQALSLCALKHKGPAWLSDTLSLSELLDGGLRWKVVLLGALGVWLMRNLRSRVSRSPLESCSRQEAACTAHQLDGYRARPGVAQPRMHGGRGGVLEVRLVGRTDQKERKRSPWLEVRENERGSCIRPAVHTVTQVRSPASSKFKASLHFRARPCFKTIKKKKREKKSPAGHGSTHL